MTQAQTLNLIEHLKQIPDYRKGKGKCHDLWLVLTLVLLGTVCGYRRYRPLADLVNTTGQLYATYWSYLRTRRFLPTQRFAESCTE